MEKIEGRRNSRNQQKNHKPKKKFNWRIFLASILFVIAAILLAADPIRTFLLSRLQAEQSQINSSLTLSAVKANELQEAEFDFSKVEPIDLNQVLKANMKKGTFLTLGQIAVPSVKLNLPIYKGLANEVLLSGAGTMKPTQKMGQGNYALASHNYFGDMTLLFSPLVNLKVGDKIYTTDLEYVYEYETTSVELIEPTRVEVINDQPGVTEITLITCDDYNATKRYCFKGKYVSKTPVSEASDSVKQAFNLNLNTIQ